MNWIVRQRADGASVGFVQATVTIAADSTAELAWAIAEGFQHRGYAREATATVLDCLRAQGVSRFVANIRPEHVASMAVARATGLLATDEVIDGEICWIRDEGASRPLRTQ